MKLDTPTNPLVAKYIQKFNSDDGYYPADEAIIKLFNAFPENKVIEDVLMKISVLNDLYSTQIYATYRLAEHILNLGIDNQLLEGDPGAVQDIASGHGITNKKGTEINFYSFATKYCNWHNREAYAIYDSFVEKVIMGYKNQDSFSEFKKSDLKDFRLFKGIIEDFVRFYNLTDFDLKEIDKFLWIYGKEKFPTTF